MFSFGVVMIFNSWDFLLFFPSVTALYFLVRPLFRYIVLLVSSCVFYMAFVPEYILIIFLTIIVDYCAGIRIERAEGNERLGWFLLSVIVTCLILFFFKYFDFFAENANYISGWLGGGINIEPLKLILPVGLSFHTFQSLSYVIEVYRGNQKAERHFGIYSLYVLFYPQLVAGPIERPQNLLHQFHDKHNFEHRFNYQEVTSGLRLMAWGMLKKAVVADRLALFVSPVYDAPTQYGGGVLFFATLFFTFQIYCDFSGYSDIARGAARVMGFNLMINFDNPYLATSLSSFWRRWHISLSTWLRDYIFDPVAIGLRDWGLNGIVLAFILTFAISGIWHGANWTYVVWGLLHGAGLSLESIFSKQRKRLSKCLPPWIFNIAVWALTFSFINLSYVFFRARNITDAALIVKSIGGWLIHPLSAITNLGETVQASSQVIAYSSLITDMLLILALVSAEYLHGRFNIGYRIATLPNWLRWPIYHAAIIGIAFGGEWLGARNFIYFQF